MLRLAYSYRVLVIASLLALCACGDSSSGPVSPNPSTISARGSGIIVYACQYGGEYPACNPPPSPVKTGQQESGWCSTWDDCGTGTGNDGGNGDVGGGSDGLDPTPEQELAGEICDPALDPACLVTLSGGDRRTLERALSAKVNGNATDATCSLLADQFQNELAAGRVYRGATSSADHDGLTYQGKIHIDNDVFMELRAALNELPQTDGSRQRAAAAQARLAGLAMHEAAHTVLKPDGRPLWSHGDNEGATGYTSYPFNMMDQRVSGEKCVKF